MSFDHLHPNLRIDGFRCGLGEIDHWFAGKATAAHREGSLVVVCATKVGHPARPVGFYVLATVAEEVARLPDVKVKHRFRAGDHFSALQLVWLAVDRGFQGQGIGTRLMAQVLRTFTEVSPRIGLPALIVMPHPENRERLKTFYGTLDFEESRDGTTMFLPLAVAIAARAPPDAT